MWYPDNVPRANRLQQLVDSIANLQTDVINAGKDMAANDIKDAINELLKQRGMSTPDDIIKAAEAEMTPEQRKQYEALVNATKKESTPFQWTFFVAGILMAPEGAILGAQGAMAAMRFVFRAQFVQKIAQFFQAAQTGDAQAAADLASEIADTATETAEDLDAVAGGGETGVEIAEAASLMSKIGTLCKILGIVGVIVTGIAAVLEAYEEGKQKAQLISNIHKLQPVRLNTAFLQQEINNIDQQLQLIIEYVKFLKTDPTVAKALGGDITKNISAADSKIDLGALETQLEQQDETSSLYYGGDNLSHDDVVNIAQGKSKIQ